MKDEREQKRLRRRAIIRAVVVEILVIVLIWYLLPPAGSWLTEQPWSGLGPYTGPIVQQGQTFRPSKTLWDWLDLLIIPTVLAVGALLFNQSARRNETRIAEERRKEEARIAEDRLQEAALQTYLDRMGELLMDRGLGRDGLEEVKDVAYARTQTALRSLNPERKSIIIRFLIDSGLVQGSNAQENGPTAPLLRSSNTVNKRATIPARRGPWTVPDTRLGAAIDTDSA
jgi:hypothetical protein